MYSAHNISAILHDLRTPLASCRLCVKLLSEADLDKKNISVLNIMKEELDKADELIRLLLDIRKSHKQFLSKKKKLDLFKLIEKEVKKLQLESVQKIKFSHRGDVKGSFSKEGMTRLIDNLLSNAVKYSDPKREITISLKGLNNSVEFSVQNFGKPIPKNHLSNIFEPYYRIEGRTQKPGWGLGLSLVKKIVTNHEGTISVKSSLKEGTTFKVILPKTSTRQSRRSVK